MFRFNNKWYLLNNKEFPLSDKNCYNVYNNLKIFNMTKERRTEIKYCENRAEVLKMFSMKADTIKYKLEMYGCILFNPVASINTKCS